MVREIVKYPADILSSEAADVCAKSARSPEMTELIQDLADTVRHHQALGLAAPQIGVAKKVAVALVNQVWWVMINPRVYKQAGRVVQEECCLSFPGFYGDVPRPHYVELEVLSRAGQQRTLTARGLTARVLMHEMDHLYGRVFIQYLHSDQRRHILRQIRLKQ